MAPAMRCRAHGPLSGETCAVSGCFEPVEPDVEVPEPSAPTCPAADCGMAMPCPLHPTECPHGRVDGEVAAYLAAPDQPPQRAEPAGAGAEMRFPWGPVMVGEETLAVGRDYAVQCGAQIEEFTNVSRLHAKFSVRTGRLFVEDQASTNGTTVNGRRIAEYEPHALCDGDVIGFGAHLRAVIRLPRSTQ